MCRNAGIGYSVIDIGVNADFGDIPGLIRKKVCRGTRNFKNEPAMTRAECGQALQVGYEIGTQVKADLVGAGEMGIGNSSSASALYSLLLGIDPAITVGQGTGSYGELLEKKKRIIAEAVALHKTQWNNDPFDALRRVGGLEIAGITGLIFGCATQRIPVAVDGFIASSAALTALRMNPAVREYLFFSHKSAESFHADFLTGEGIRPVLDLEMRLGEGTGAVLAMQIISQAMACYRLMATFSGAGVSGEKK
jgi:nicotinate-nucleotide--dimethylbenzimidazole phosphoribosyltransferase